MKPKTVLVLATHAPHDASVVSDYLLAFPRYSRHRFRFMALPEEVAPECDLTRFDVILLFWSYYWVEPNLPPVVMEKIRCSPALKVFMLQDEYRQVRQANRIMNRLGVNVMLTNVALRNHSLFYPVDTIPSLLHVETVLTGYVPDYLQRDLLPDWTCRPTTIGYRSRKLPFALGDLGQEKTWIAERFRAICEKEGLTYDISVREEDRIYGKAWLNFLSRCRFSLGTESGASVIDFDGGIERGCLEHLARYPEATYQEVKRAVFADLDWQAPLATISPRVFEAAALGSVLILHEGDYLGILRPDKHYIAVRKDYSNIREVLDRMHDQSYCLTLRQNAHSDLIVSGHFSYKPLIQRFDSILDRFTPTDSTGESCGATRFYLRNYLKHTRVLIPYRGRAWLAFSWTSLFFAFCLVKELVLQPVLPVLLLLTALEGARHMARTILYHLFPRRFPRPGPLELCAGSVGEKSATCAVAKRATPDDSLNAQSTSFRSRCKFFVKTLLIVAWLRQLARGKGYYSEPLRVRLVKEEDTRTLILKTELAHVATSADLPDHCLRFLTWFTSRQRIRWVLDNSRFHNFIPFRLAGFYVPLRLGEKQFELSRTLQRTMSTYPWLARWLLRSLFPMIPPPIRQAPVAGTRLAACRLSRSFRPPRSQVCPVTVEQRVGSAIPPRPKMGNFGVPNLGQVSVAGALRLLGAASTVKMGAPATPAKCPLARPIQASGRPVSPVPVRASGASFPSATTP